MAEAAAPAAGAAAPAMGGFDVAGMLGAIDDSIGTVRDTTLTIQQTYADDACMASLIVWPIWRQAVGRVPMFAARLREFEARLELAIERAIREYGRPDARYVGAGIPFPTRIAQRYVARGTPLLPIGDATWVRNHLASSGANRPSTATSGGTPIGTSGLFLVGGRIRGAALASAWDAWVDEMIDNVAPATDPSARVHIGRIRIKLAEHAAELPLLEDQAARAEAECAAQKQAEQDLIAWQLEQAELGRDAGERELERDDRRSWGKLGAAILIAAVLSGGK